MSKRVSLDRLRDISKQRWIRKPLAGAPQWHLPENQEEPSLERAEWPLAS
jgi:hypothetical protein